jgi:hypothetical protein
VEGIYGNEKNQCQLPPGLGLVDDTATARGFMRPSIRRAGGEPVPRGGPVISVALVPPPMPLLR